MKPTKPNAIANSATTSHNPAAPRPDASPDEPGADTQNAPPSFSKRVTRRTAKLENPSNNAENIDPNKHSATSSSFPAASTSDAGAARSETKPSTNDAPSSAERSPSGPEELGGKNGAGDTEDAKSLPASRISTSPHNSGSDNPTESRPEPESEPESEEPDGVDRRDIEDGIIDILQSAESRQFAGTSEQKCAPNPLLSVTGLGNVGIPFTTARAGASSRKSAQRYTKVEFLNPQWGEWLQEQATDLSTRHLGVSESKVAFECAIAFQAGDNFEQLDGQVNSAWPSAFARMLVVLPSFGGYQLMLRNPKGGVPKPTVLESATTCGDTKVAAWFLGASQQFSTESPCMCILYTLHLPDQGRTPPTLPEEAAMVTSLCKIFNRWRLHCPVPIVWALSAQYKDLVNLDPSDRGCLELLSEVARRTNYKLFTILMTYKRSGTAEGWVDPESDYYAYGYEYGYDSEADDQAEVDGNGLHTIDESEGANGALLLKKFINYPSQKSALPLGCEIIVGEPDAYVEELLSPGLLDLGLTKPDHEEYDRYSGEVEHMWKRTAAIMIPKNGFESFVTAQFGWKAVALLDERFWKEEEQRERHGFALTLESRVLKPVIGEETNIPGHGSVRSSAYQQRNVSSPKGLEECKSIFLKYALGEQNKALTSKIIEIWGPPAGMGSVRVLYRTFRESDKQLATQVVKGHALEPDVLRERLNRIFEICGRDAPETAELMEAVVPLGDARRIVPPQDVPGLESQFGREFVLQTVLPRLGHYSDRSYWVQVLEHFHDKDVLETYLPKVIAEYAPSVHMGFGTRSDRYSFAMIPGLISLCLDPKNNLSPTLVPTALFDCILTKTTFESRSEGPVAWLHILEQLLPALQSGQNPLATHPSTQRFFLSVLAEKILSPLGRQPAVNSNRPVNYSLPRLPTCSEGTRCTNCYSVTAFLVSSDDSKITLRKTIAERKHLLHEFFQPYSGEGYSHRDSVKYSEHQPAGRVGGITLEKVGLGHKEKLARWDRLRSTVQKSVEKIPGELLGSAEAIVRAAVAPRAGGYMPDIQQQLKNAIEECNAKLAEIEDEERKANQKEQDRPLREAVANVLAGDDMKELVTLAENHPAGANAKRTRGGDGHGKQAPIPRTKRRKAAVNIIDLTDE